MKILQKKKKKLRQSFDDRMYKVSMCVCVCMANGTKRMIGMHLYGTEGNGDSFNTVPVL